MGFARLVVVEGPDVGCEFTVPLRGGGIGRGEGNAVQLSDLAVSRSHCSLELREGRLALRDHGSRNKTVVNGKPIELHPLSEGDEIAIGKTRLVFLPPEGGVAVLQQRVPSRVTMEVGSGELLKVQAGGGEQRARRHLASVASFGETLRGIGDRSALGRAACEATVAALAADRAFLVQRDSRGGMSPSAASVKPNDPAGTQVSLSGEVVDKVLTELKAVALQGGAGESDRPALAAPLGPGAGRPPIGLLYADRRAGEWDDVDLMAAGCLAHLVSAAIAGLESREALERENRDLEERLGGGEFVGSSERARQVLAFVAKVGPSDATVLLTGESGSGKEMVARATHRASRRAGQAFVAVNCAALTESLIESELFGHEKGAFTGATERKIGRFEAADKGTLFLDEVGELPLGCQTKFLRVLEEQCFERVGGTKPIGVDVRVVAATNRDLAAMVRRGTFREDLFYRLSVIHTVVPPLRERPGDIPELAEYFLARLRSQVARRIVGFSRDAMEALVSHPWPGNVRELRNAIERAIVLGDGEHVRLQDLPPEIAGASPAPRPAPAPAVWHPPRTAQEMQAVAPPPSVAPTPGPGALPPVAPPPAAARSLKDLEREGIVAALQATGGNKAQAAQILEIDRSTLYKKIKDYGIET